MKLFAASVFLLVAGAMSLTINKPMTGKYACPSATPTIIEDEPSLWTATNVFAVKACVRMTAAAKACGTPVPSTIVVALTSGDTSVSKEHSFDIVEGQKEYCQVFQPCDLLSLEKGDKIVLEGSKFTVTATVNGEVSAYDDAYTLSLEGTGYSVAKDDIKDQAVDAKTEINPYSVACNGFDCTVTPDAAVDDFTMKKATLTVTDGVVTKCETPAPATFVDPEPTPASVVITSFVCKDGKTCDTVTKFTIAEVIPNPDPTTTTTTKAPGGEDTTTTTKATEAGNDDESTSSAFTTSVLGSALFVAALMA